MAKNERPDTLNAMQKKSDLGEVPLLKKEKKTQKKCLPKKWFFFAVFCKELRFVVLRSVYQEAPFEPSKSTINKKKKSKKINISGYPFI